MKPPQELINAIYDRDYSAVSALVDWPHEQGDHQTAEWLRECSGACLIGSAWMLENERRPRYGIWGTGYRQPQENGWGWTNAVPYQSETHRMPLHVMRFDSTGNYHLAFETFNAAMSACAARATEYVEQLRRQ